MRIPSDLLFVEVQTNVYRLSSRFAQYIPSPLVSAARRSERSILMPSWVSSKDAGSAPVSRRRQIRRYSRSCHPNPATRFDRLAHFPTFATAFILRFFGRKSPLARLCSVLCSTFQMQTHSCFSASCFSFCSALSLMALRRASGSFVSEASRSSAFRAFSFANSFCPSAK